MMATVILNAAPASLAPGPQARPPVPAFKPGIGQQGRAEAEAREVAEAFESAFLAQVLQQAFASIPTDGPFGGGQSEAVYRSLLTEQYAASVAKGGGIGIADAVLREILKTQELARP